MTSGTPTAPPTVVADAVAEAVARAKGGDALAPATVVAPNGYAAVAARRALTRSLTGGVANVSFTTAGELVRRLGGRRLAAERRRLASAAVELEAIRVVAASAAPRWCGLATQPRALTAIARTFAELRRWTAEGFESLARQSGPSAEVVGLLVAVRRHLEEHGFADALDLRDRAVAAAREEPGLDIELGPLVVLALPELAPAEEALLEVLGGRLGWTRLPDEPARSCTQLQPCADPDEEARAAVRAVLAGAEDGVALWQQAILHPPGPHYGRLLHQHLAAASIPTTGPELGRLDRSTAGHTLVGLLALAGSEWSRQDVMALLTASPLRTGPDGRSVPVSRWNAVSAAAGVVRGLPQWRDRLARLASTDDAVAGEAAALGEFVAGLACRLDGGGATWAERAQAAVDLLDHYLDVDGGGAWPAAQVAALAQVRDAVRGLGELDAMGRGADAVAFQRAVQAQLERGVLDSRDGGGQGVFVAPYDQARGMRFHTVVLTGLADGIVPGFAGDDALLPDAVRRMDGSGALRTRARRQEDLFADVSAALSAGDERRIVTYPRIDPRTGRAHVPSRWLDPLASASTRHTPVDSFPAALRLGGPSLSTTDLRLRSLERWRRGDISSSPMVWADPTLRTGIDAVRSRAGRAFTRFDGLVPAGAVTPFDPEHPVSATRLELYAECPRRFLFDRVLGISERTLPEDLWRIEARDRGSLVHAILERYVVERIDGAPRSLERLLAIGEEYLDDATAGGMVGKPLLWRLDRAAIRRDLRVFHAEEGELVPLAAEFAFGSDPGDAGAPVAVGLPNGRTVRFRGRADRVDRAPDGALVVSDYKTGRQRGLAKLTNDPLVGGRRLQLPLYALAARDQFGAAGTVEARYWMVSAERQTACYHLELTDDVEAHFRDVVGRIAMGVEAGAFPGIPGPPRETSFEGCAYCDFDRVCPATRDRQWAAKRGALEVAPVNDLLDAEVPDEVAGAVERGTPDRRSRP
ncbi:MAG: PD-(D/E)XK nuclease family protein [Acidimicrobiales bacterium]